MLNAHAVSHPQEFQASGAFTFKQRLVESLKANLKFYAIILATGLVIVIWMAIYNNLGPSALSATMVAAANTYGMLLIVVMLGYGLVEVPRLLQRLLLLQQTTHTSACVVVVERERAARVGCERFREEV